MKSNARSFVCGLDNKLQELGRGQRTFIGVSVLLYHGAVRSVTRPLGGFYCFFFQRVKRLPRVSMLCGVCGYSSMTFSIFSSTAAPVSVPTFTNLRAVLRGYSLFPVLGSFTL